MREIRVREGCTWPERVGLLGHTVEPPSDGTYPQPGRSEVLVRLYDDPLTDLERERDFPRNWTCVMNVRHVEWLNPPKM